MRRSTSGWVNIARFTCKFCLRCVSLCPSLSDCLLWNVRVSDVDLAVCAELWCDVCDDWNGSVATDSLSLQWINHQSFFCFSTNRCAHIDRGHTAPRRYPHPLSKGSAPWDSGLPAEHTKTWAKDSPRVAEMMRTLGRKIQFEKKRISCPGKAESCFLRIRAALS